MLGILEHGDISKDKSSRLFRLSETLCPDIKLEMMLVIVYDWRVNRFYSMNVWWKVKVLTKQFTELIVI